jgi:hypothetical protein
MIGFIKQRAGGYAHCTLFPYCARVPINVDVHNPQMRGQVPLVGKAHRSTTTQLLPVRRRHRADSQQFHIDFHMIFRAFYECPYSSLQPAKISDKAARSPDRNLAMISSLHSWENREEKVRSHQALR